jgi:beta-N-acetylhexosaminidase
MRFLCVSIICLLILPSCTKRASVNSIIIEVNKDEKEETAPVIDPLRTRAFEIASALDNRLLAAQLLISGIDGRESLQPHIKTLFTDHPPGGVMLFSYNLNTDNDSIRSHLSQVSTLIRDKSGIPPFIAVDHEGGVVYRFQGGVAALPPASSYWETFLSHGKERALEKITDDVLTAGREINKLGINMNFAPVAEYLTDDNRVFLESRSYGPEPSFTAEASAAFIRAMEQAGVLCAVKHFPSSSGPDPHYSPSVLNGNKAELDRLIFPFAYVFNNGARAVMVAHSSIPAMDDKIASLSPVVMGNWLRLELGFEGIIISDDFFMEAAGSAIPEEAAILSVAAGADMVLVWQSDLSRTHATFISALDEGRLSRERCIGAVSHIIYEKLKLGLLEEE